MPIALITGAGIRLGKALAISFASKGWSVVLHFYNSKENAEYTDGFVRAYKVDDYQEQAD